MGLVDTAWGFLGCLWRDIRSLMLYLRFQLIFKKISIFREVLPRQFDAIVERLPNKTAIIYGAQGERIRFIDLQRFSRRVAHWIESSLDLGLDDGKLPQICNESPSAASGVDSLDPSPLRHHQIGLLLGNTPEMVGFFMGVARCRAAAVLFNHNQRRDSLLNAFQATSCRVLVFDVRYLDALREIAAQLPEGMRFFPYDRTKKRRTDVNNNRFSYDKANYREFVGLTREELLTPGVVENFAPILELYPDTPTERKYSYELTDNIVYFFTSGTTGGAVKATPANNVRFIVGYLSQKHAFSLREDDHFYISLPLYHSFPGIVGVGRCVMGGSTITLVDKFSASRFWSDCRSNQCTVALYIGEICRYLLARPKHPDETSHSLRMLHGLGLKREIWREFAARFKVGRIAEFYGSSEGNINLFNVNGVEGSCGFIPYYFGPLTRFLYPIFLIKVDPVTLEPIRTKSGLCTLARPGDVGQVLGAIRPGFAYTRFLGYTSPEESRKKLLHNILSQGDSAFVSGDLMEMDVYGNLYFRDRTGDTFRWKGENVSTTEVESIAAQYLDHRQCTVYGVMIPFTDGRAGMIAIAAPTPTDRSSISLCGLYRYLTDRVPEYAVPKFVRLTDRIETTSTHKLIKYRLREEGFCPLRVTPGDELFYLDRTSPAGYVPLTEAVYEAIDRGLIRF